MTDQSNLRFVDRSFKFCIPSQSQSRLNSTADAKPGPIAQSILILDRIHSGEGIQLQPELAHSTHFGLTG
jgi:hypothetical protein